MESSWNQCKSFRQQLSLFKLSMAIILTVLVGLLFWGGDKLGNFHKTYENHPKIFNLDDYIVETRLKFEKPVCEQFNVHCYAQINYDDKSWIPTKLSKENYRLYKGFNSNGGTALFRIKFKVPDQLLTDDAAVGVSFIGPSFQFIKFYFNGSELSDQDGSNWINKAGVFSLPRGLILKGENLITFVTKYKATDRGFLHSYHNLIGAKQIIDLEYITNERSANTYYIVFLVLKLGLFTFFCLLFLFSETQPFLRYFLIYALCISVDSLFVSDFFADLLSYNIRLFFLLNFQCLAFVFLWLLIETLLGANSILQRRIMIGQIVVLNIILVLFYHGQIMIRNSTIFELEYLIKLEVIGAIVIILLKTFIRDSKKIVADAPISHILIIFSSYFFLHLIHHFVIEKLGNNVQQEIDVLLFFGIAYLTFREFTENKIRLRESQKTIRAQSNDVRLGKSVARIAHDLRKPFNNFRIAIQSLETPSTKPEMLLTMTTQILESVNYAESLIEEILESKRSQILKLNQISVNNLIEQVNILLGSKIRQNGIELSITGDTNGELMIDQAKILSVFQNIINNAEEAFGEQAKKQIWIHTRIFQSSLGRARVRFIIGNNGPPIPSHIVDRLFKTEISHGKMNGTGLGLTGVSEIISSHNGEISVRNLPFKKGVEFEILLNLVPQQILVAHEQETQTKLNSEDSKIQTTIRLNEIRRIALVDDDSLIHMAWNSIWNKDELLTFGTPEDFLRSIECEPDFLKTLDVIITDLYFGSESLYSGIEFAKVLREKGFYNIVLCTGTEKDMLDKDLAYLFAEIWPKVILSKIELLKRLGSK